MAERKIRVLLAKLGLDSHTVGVTVIAQALRDAGMEVIYTSPWQQVPAVARLERISTFRIEPANQSATALPRRIGAYKILDELGRGGQGLH